MTVDVDIMGIEGGSAFFKVLEIIVEVFFFLRFVIYEMLNSIPNPLFQKKAFIDINGTSDSHLFYR